MKWFFPKIIKWYQVVIIGILSGTIPPMFELASVKWGHIGIGLFVLFFMYNIIVENRKNA